MNKPKTKEKSEQEQLPLAPQQEGNGNLPAEMDEDLSQYRGQGLENVTAADIIIPRMVILQALSPQVTPGKPEYIDAAKIGYFCNTATGDLFPTGTELLPVYFAKVYLEWAPNRGGLVQNWGTDDKEFRSLQPNEKGKHVRQNGNNIVETYTFYCINVPDMKRVFVPLSSTQTKHARKWLSLITGQRAKDKQGRDYQPAIWYRSWHAKAVDESNPSGSWKSWSFSPGRLITELERDLGFRLRDEAIAFANDVKSGAVKGDISEEDAAAAGRVPDESAPF